MLHRMHLSDSWLPRTWPGFMNNTGFRDDPRTGPVCLLWGKMNIERISAVTLKVNNMETCVKFYRDILGLKLLYGGEHSSFSSFCTADEDYAILNLEQGRAVSDWGRIIFYVDDVDRCHFQLKQKGFDPQLPRDAEWGERYFHMLDPDGNELSFARPLK